MRIAVEHLSIQFTRGVEAVHDLSFEVDSGEFVAIVGPSGCGKSTVLNALGSILSPEVADITGRLMIGGKELKKWNRRELNLGYVFQRDSLYPWFTIAENVAAGLTIRGVPAARRTARVNELLALAGLAGFEHYYPHQVSGGMRQRAALMRSLAYDPEVILMDEPFGALDAQTRMELQAELMKIWNASRRTIIFVTHDLAEAITLAQRVLLFTRRPSRLRRIYTIDLPQPRDPFDLRGSTEFARLEAELWSDLREDIRDAGRPDIAAAVV
jgi:NitT/TauT family transport system ATP-binding protein